MAVTFTGAGTAVAASGASPQAVTTATSFAVGDYLVALMAYDNSGGGGADPMSGTFFIQGGFTGTSASSQTGHNDPGAASAGLAARCEVFPVTSTINSGTNLSVTWTGTVVVRAVALMKVSSNAGGTVAYRTRNGATGANGVNVTTKQQTQAANNGEGVLLWAGYEYGAAVVGDTDTFVGTYSAVYGANTGSTTSGMAAYFQSKVISANATVTWDPTAAVASDWITGALVFTETLPPSISQSAYRFYTEGAENTSTALGSQDTAYSPNAISDLNLQLRVRLQETGAVAVPATSDFKLQYAKNGGAWTDVYSNPSVLTTYPFSQYVSWTGVANAAGQSFTGNGEKLARMAFDIHKFGAPPGTYTAALYAHSGTFGTSSIATGAALKTSTTVINGTDLVSGFGWVFFEFDSTYTLVNGTNYVMALTRSTAGDASNLVEIVYDSVAPTRPGNACTFNGSTWTAVGGTDYMTQVYTVPTTPPTNVVGHFTPAMYGSTTAIVEEQPTTQRLTAGTGSFVAAGNMTGVGVCEGIGWSVSNYVEVLYGITLKAADLANGDTLTFRVLRNNAALTAYTATPTLNVIKIAPAITQAAYRFFDDAGTESGAAALAAQDTPVTGNIANGDGYGMIRVRLQSTSAVDVPLADDFRLQYEKNASGSWNNVLPLTAIEDYGWGNESNWVTLGSTAGFTRAGQSFTGNGEKLCRVGWSINKSGNPTGTLTCTLYAHTGTYGVTGVPTGAVLATATTSIVATAIPGSGSVWTYFNFDETFTLVNGTRYFITINYSLTGDDVNVVIVDSDNTTSTLSGNKAVYISSWGALGSEDMLIKLYTTAVSPQAAVVAYDNPNLTEGAATTNRLTGGSGTYSAGKVSEQGNVVNVGWSGNNYTEILYSVRVVAAVLAHGDTLRFRAVKNGSTADMTYSATPTINVVLPPPTPPPVIGKYLDASIGTASTPDLGPLPNPCIFVFGIVGPTGTYANTLASQWLASGGTENSWLLNRWASTGPAPGNQLFHISADGAGSAYQSYGPWEPITGSLQYLAYSVQQSPTFHAQPWSSTDGTNWATTGDAYDAGSAAPVRTTSLPIVVGGPGLSAAGILPWPGPIYFVELRTGLNPTGGTVVWRFNANDHVSGTSWVDEVGKTWTITNAAAIKVPVVNYNETNRPVVITSTTTSTDKAGRKELDRPVAIVSAVTSTEVKHLYETAFDNYLNVPAGWATAPDQPVPPSQSTFVWKVRGPRSLNPDNNGNGATIVSHAATGGQASWMLTRKFNVGIPSTNYAISSDGSVNTSQRNAPTPDVRGDQYWAYVIDRAAGSTKLYSTTTYGNSWVQEGATVTGTALPTPFDSTTTVKVGSSGGAITYGEWDSRIYWVELRTGVDPAAGTILWRFDANEWVSGTSFADARGLTWTLTAGGAVVAAGGTKVTSAATVTSTDQLKIRYVETGLSVAIVSTATTTDQVDFKDLDRPVTTVSAVATAVDQADFKELHGVAAPGYATFPGGSGLNSLTTPEYAGLHNAEDFTVVARVRPATSWVNAAPVTIGCRAAAANQWSWTFRVLNTGALSHTYSTTGTSLPGVNSTVTIPAAGFPVDWLWVAVTFDGNNGASGKTSRFWTSPDGTAWTQLGADVTSATAVTLFNSNAGLMIGQFSNISPQGWIGDIQHFSVRSGWGAGGTVGGTETFRITGNELTDPNAASFIAATGQLVTVNRAAVDPKTIITIAVVAGNPAISAISTVTSTDVPGVGTQHYDETGRPLLLISASSSTDQADFKELDRPVAVIATTTSTALLKLGERDRPVAIVSAVTTTDVLKRGERDRPVTIIATTAATGLLHIGERDRPLVVISTVSRTDVIHYGERDRAVTVVSATTTAVDQADLEEQLLAFTVASIVTSTDSAVAGAIHYDETGRLLLTSSTVSSTDQADYDMLGLGVAVISTVTNSVDQTDYDMLGLSTAVASTVATTDPADFRDVSTHAATTTFAVTEQYGYGALALPVVVASAVTTTDQADYDQLTLPVVVASAVTTTDLLKRGERLLPVAVISATTTTDQADFEDPARSVAIISVVTVGDNQMSPGHFDETNRPVSLLLTTTLWVDQTDYDQLALAVVGASTVTLPVDQTDYDQLALPVAAAATTAVTDTIKRGERDRPVTIVATASSTDVVHWRGPALSVTASSTVASTDLLKRGELARGVVVVSTVTPTDSWRRRDLALPVVAAATVATTDQADFKQLALPVVITSAVTSLDIVIGGPVHYNETGKQINIVSAVATTDRADFNQTLTVSVVAATSCTDQRKHGERNTPVTVASQVASTDQADLHDLVSVSIISATTLTPTVVMRDLIKPIDIDATVTSTERSDLSEVVLFNLATLFGSVDTADYSQMLDLLLVSQVILNDVMHGQIGVLTDAIAIYLGDQPVSRVYVGDVQVWEEN